MPEGCPRAWVIGSHGLMSSMQSTKQMEMGSLLVREEMAFLRFTYGGSGESRQLDPFSPISRRRRELERVVELARLRFPGIPGGLFGSSLGAYLSLIHAAGNIGIGAVVSWACPVDFSTLKNNIDGGRIDRLYGLDPSVFQPSIEAFFGDTKKNPLVGPKNALIVHGERDELVPLEHAHMVFGRCLEPKELYVVPGGDHRFEEPKARSLALRRSLDWFRERLG